MTNRSAILSLLAIALAGCAAVAADAPPSSKPATTQPKMVQAHNTTTAVLLKPDSWFTTPAGRHLTDIVASWQNANGGWWKEYDPTALRPPALPGASTHDGPPGDAEDSWRRTSTFDNNATYTEIRILAKAQRVTDNPKYRDAVERGLKFIFDSQYPTGGWPQRFPIEPNYGKNITYNDGAMVGVMFVLKDVYEGKPDFAFISKDQRAKAKAAFDRGIQCILNSQIKRDGRLTAWCQQHDPQTLAPANARAYELPSLTPSESTGIVVLLMSLDHPDDRVRQSIAAAIQWFQDVKITGKRVTTVTGPQYESGRDKAVIDDPSAPPMWARFYDLETNQPFFCSRDGVKRANLADISYERRNHYAWYGNWPEKVLAAYPKWKERHAGEAP